LFSTEAFIGIYLPALIAVGIAATSILAAVRTGTMLQVIICAVLVVAMAFCLLMLWAMLRGAWPSFLPHIIIGAAVPLVLVQRLLATRTQMRFERIRR